jgi:hypothetical protein
MTLVLAAAPPAYTLYVSDRLVSKGGAPHDPLASKTVALRATEGLAAFGTPAPHSARHANGYVALERPPPRAAAQATWARWALETSGAQHWRLAPGAISPAPSPADRTP